MPELSELFEQAKALVDLSKDEARDAAVEALKKSWQPFYQALTNLGFGAAQAKFTTELTDAKTARQTAETKLVEAQQAHALQIRTLQDKAPDVATVNQQWESKITEERERHSAEKRKLKDQIRSVLLQRDQASLETLLIERDVPRAVAKRVAKDPDLLPTRGDYADDGSLSVRQAGQQIPFAPGSGQTHLTLLADEVVALPDMKEILVSNGDSGGGVSGREQPGRGDSAFYDSLRKGVKDGVVDGVPTKPLRERMQGR